jgi:predicted SAM-dependent methyltransferase
MKVEIGCGGTKNEGFIGIDRFELPGVDIVADINEGLPIEENRVSLLFSSHSLEHFADLPKVMKEIYRVCKHGAQVCIVVPYHETLLNKANPYHLQVFNEHTFRFFSKENNYF